MADTTIWPGLLHVEKVVAALTDAGVKVDRDEESVVSDARTFSSKLASICFGSSICFGYSSTNSNTFLFIPKFTGRLLE